MSKTILITFGWTEKPVIASAFYHGLLPEDRIVFLIPSINPERSKTLISDLKGFLEKYVPGVVVEVKEINVVDFSAAVKEIKDIMEKSEKVLLVLGGGMRILNIEGYVAALLSSKDVLIQVMIEGSRWNISTIPKIPLSSILKLSKQECTMIKLLSRREFIPLTDIRRELNLPASTAHKLVKRMTSKGLIIKEMIRGRIILRLTELGKLFSATV